MMMVGFETRSVRCEENVLVLADFNPQLSFEPHRCP